MEPAPSSKPFKSFLSPRKKRKMSHISENEKIMIINVFKYVKETWTSDKYPSKMDMKKKTADILGIGNTSVYSVLREYKETDIVRPPASPKRRPNLVESVDDFDKSCIRKKVHEFYLKGEMPTLNRILQAVNSDDMLPNFSRTWLWRLLKALKFKYIKKKRNSALIERHDIVLWRIKYLKKIKKFREEGRPIYYLDETWVNAGHTVIKVWEDTTVKSVIQAFLEGLSTGAKNPTSKGNRLIVIHIRNEKGFLPGSQWVFENKATGDYHETMNAEGFENWFKNVLEKVDASAVIVMDNATYHSRRQERLPVTSWKKQNIKEWLASKEILFDEKETKVELLAKVKAVERYMSYVTDKMAKQRGTEILRLPPYHCELNPIELVWADVKGYVPRNNITFKMTDVKRLLEEGLNKIDETKWKNCVDHVIKEETKLNGVDHAIDKTVDSFLINVTDSSTSSSSENDDSETDSDAEGP
ncbi:hypothetical protein evm_011978 [Chilo suppressalis]|nr:hypothetical protein evm_011978 [Chilo suppressalis]